MLKDLGTAIANGDFNLNPNLTISLTAVALSGLPVRIGAGSVEVCHEVFGYMGSFVLPITVEEMKDTVRVNGMISFKILVVVDEVEASTGEAFRLIRCEIV